MSEETTALQVVEEVINATKNAIDDLKTLLVEDFDDDAGLAVIKMKNIELAKKHQLATEKLITNTRMLNAGKRAMESIKRRIALEVAREQFTKSKNETLDKAEKECETMVRIGDDIINKIGKLDDMRGDLELILKNHKFIADRLHDASIAESSIKKYGKDIGDEPDERTE